MSTSIAQVTAANTTDYIAAEVPMSRLEMARKAAADAVASKLAARKEEAELALLSSDTYRNSLVEQAMREETTGVLANLNDMCKAIVDTNPVMSATLKQKRTWNPSKRYGLGNQIAELVGLLTGIQYSVAEHNELMLSVTGLTRDLIERSLDAFGQLPYYSTANDVVVEGSPACASSLQECLVLLEVALGINLDKSKITQAVLDNQYHIAHVKAERIKAEAALSTAVQNFVIR